jgi:hypothetical protein
MALAILAIDQAYKFFHEGRVVGWIVMAAASRAQIAMRGNTRTDASASMTNWNLQMMAQVSGHPRGGCDQSRLEAAIREAAHLDADRAAIETACVPSIVGEVDHLRCLGPVLSDHVMRGHPGRAQFEPSDSALVTTLAIVHYYEVDPRALAARAIGGRPPEK